MKASTILYLTAIAGFIDTVTFISVGGLFAAHVTGNFVVFGASLANSMAEHDYLKLIAFPVFIISIMFGAFIFGRTRNKKFGGVSLLLFLQALIFVIVSVVAYVFPSHIFQAYLALMLVVGMGIQNSLHRYVPGPMTTVMTGTVMNWSAAQAEKIFKLPVPEAKISSGKPQPQAGWMIASFALGCLFAGFVTKELALSASMIPALLLFVLSMVEFPREVAKLTVQTKLKNVSTPSDQITKLVSQEQAIID